MATVHIRLQGGPLDGLVQEVDERLVAGGYVFAQGAARGSHEFRAYRYRLQVIRRESEVRLSPWDLANGLSRSSFADDPAAGPPPPNRPDLLGVQRSEELVGIFEA